MIPLAGVSAVERNPFGGQWSGAILSDSILLETELLQEREIREYPQARKPQFDLPQEKPREVTVERQTVWILIGWNVHWER